MNLKLILGILTLGLSATFAQEAVPAVSAPAEEAVKNGLYYQNTLQKMKPEIPSNAYDIFLVHYEAETHVAELVQLEKDAPPRMKRTDTKAIEIQNKTEACSLYVEILKTKIETWKLQENIAKNTAERIQTLNEIEELQKQLMTKQNGENAAMAAALKAEAEAREAELKKALEEERKKAEARQQEARNKLNKLQSRLIQVTQDARGIILSMSDILFDVGKANLKNTLKQNLAKIAGILSVYQELNISIEGHTDNTGSEELNRKLSEQRALNVKDYLISHGIDSTRVTSKGLGKDMPIADNNTKEGRQKNRRVDIVIQDKTLLEQ